jgi:membrane protein
MILRILWELLRDTVIEWRENKAQRLAAALAYYTMFSLVPLLIILIGVAGRVWGNDLAEGQIFNDIQLLVGAQEARAIQTLLTSARGPMPNMFATALGALTLLFGASAMFNHLKDSLNTIWGVARRPGHAVVSWLVDRLLAFVMVLLTAGLSLLSVGIGLGLAKASATLTGRALGLPPTYLIEVAQVLLAWLFITPLFVLLYKFLPDTTIAWRDVWIGSAMTAALLVAGQVAIGLGLSFSSFASAYSVAGAIIVILIWIYYSAMILFFGAEFTWVYANRYGSRVMPAEHAVSLSVQARALQGLLRAEELAQALGEPEDAEPQPIAAVREQAEQ